MKDGQCCRSLTNPAQPLHLIPTEITHWRKPNWCAFISSVLVVFRLSLAVAHWQDSMWIRFFFPVACEVMG